MQDIKRIPVLGTGFDAVSEDTAAQLILQHIEERPAGSPPLCVFTPNPLIVMNAYTNPAFAPVLATAGLSLADGTGIVSAARRAGTPLPCRCTGIGTAEKVLSGLAARGGSFYILGGREGTAAAAAANLCAEHPGLKCSGTRNGYFTNSEIPSLIDEINTASPDLLCLCLGSPKQEELAAAYRTELRCGAVMTLGGSADVWARKVKRAPAAFRKMHLEWLWRMLREPRRFAGLPVLVRFRFLTRKRFFSIH